MDTQTESLFKNSLPIVLEAYKQLVNELKKFGPVIIEPKKTSIHIKSKSGFTGVHPRKEFFVLNIVSESPIQNERISRLEQVSKSRFHNEIKISSSTDLNAEVLSWLQAAYNLMA